MTDEYIPRGEFDANVKRIEDAERRQDKRLELLEDSVRQIGELTTSVAKIATNIESLTKELTKQGLRLEELEARDGETWRSVVRYAITAVIAGVVGFALHGLGL